MSFWDDLAGNGNSATQQYLQQALQQYQNINVPTVQSEEVNNLPQETVQGTVTPETIQAVEQAPSAYNNISLDPSSRQAMENALQGYQTIANSGGLDANALLGIQQAINSTNEQSQGAQGAIMNAAQAMGQGGGPFALTQRAIAAQGASNNAAQAGLQQAAEAEANRETALTQLANIGGQINSSDYNQAAAKAAAQNQINAVNQQYQNAANVGNVQNNATAQQFNVTNAQGVNAANTTANQNNAYYNASLPQQMFNNELAKAGGAAGVLGTQASAAQQNQANNEAGLGKLAGAAGTVLGAYYGGPAGAALGGTLGNSMSGTQAVNSGLGSTPTGANANKSNYGLAHGGTVCYAKGGVASPHDHEAICMKVGGSVPGHAAIPGDHESNDTVPAMLSPGELVIPRSVPKTGPAMEAFARNAPVAGNPNKKVDLTAFMQGYKKGR